MQGRQWLESRSLITVRLMKEEEDGNAVVKQPIKSRSLSAKTQSSSSSSASASRCYSSFLSTASSFCF